MIDGIFRDPARPLAERISDLLLRMTIAEKVSLLHQHQPAIERLGMPAFRTGTEALHGLAWLGPATVFPQALGLASTWDPDLVTAVGSAVGDEVRGCHSKDPAHVGLNVWAPVVNPLRDPRWGRNEEGYAEDPWLTGVIATAYSRGLRGDDPDYLKTAPTLKHFLAYNNETGAVREMAPRVLHEYELPAFRAPLASGAAVAVMATYNLVNGRPAHLSPLIENELRTWNAQEILVVRDAGAARTDHDHALEYAAALHAGVDSFTEDDADAGPTIRRLTEALERDLISESDIDTAVRRVLTMRLRLGDLDPPDRNPFASITADVINCEAHQELAREAARRSLVLLHNDGLLPLPADRLRRVAVLGPLAGIVYEDWYSGTLPYAVTAAEGMARRLPGAEIVTHEGVDRIALRVGPKGPHVRATHCADGAALTVGLASTGVATELEWFDVFEWGPGVVALRAAANGRHVGVHADGTLVNDRPGPGGWVVRETFRLVEGAGGGVLLHHLASDMLVCVGPDGVLRADCVDTALATEFFVELVSDGTAAAADCARDADVALVLVGNHPMVDGRQTEDRTDLDLARAQEALIRAVHAANPRSVLVISSSYPVAVNWAAEHMPAIMWSAHGGQEYGTALAELLCGDADPGGRLTQTWHRSAADLPDLVDYDVIGSDATYLYHRGTPLYPFGHGLSYTTFEWSDLRLTTSDVDADGTVEVSVTVVNTGSRFGEDVVQLYTRQRRSRVKQPLRQLRGFERVALQPRESTVVRLRLHATDLAHWDVTRGRFVVEEAHHTVAVGRSCTDLVLTATLAVHGERIPARDLLSAPLSAESCDESVGTAFIADAVAARAPDAWLRFAAVDLRGPLQHVTAAMRGPAGSSLTLRSDDPVFGAVLARFPADPSGEPGSVSSAIPGTDGVRDLYLVFSASDLTVSTLTFG